MPFCWFCREAAQICLNWKLQVLITYSLRAAYVMAYLHYNRPCKWFYNPSILKVLPNNWAIKQPTIYWMGPKKRHLTANIFGHIRNVGVLTRPREISKLLRLKTSVSLAGAGYVFAPKHDKNSKIPCASSEDSDQPWHPPSLISLRCPHEETWVLSFPLTWVFAGHTA